MAGFIFDYNVATLTAVGSLIDVVLLQQESAPEMGAGHVQYMNDKAATATDVVLSKVSDDVCNYVSTIVESFNS